MTGRVWRVRKHHTWIDATIQDDDALAGAEVRCDYNGEPIYSRSWPTRELALIDADLRLRDLLRAGWTTHW